MTDNRVRKTRGRNKQAVALMKLEGIKYTEALRRVRTEIDGSVGTVCSSDKWSSQEGI